ncbi:DeoR/GlpR family DNA-binding transcription regulator [Niallia taxi]|uniref:DeoR/GlpR family DNA-binding transcription regulator n=1 Tax=Niallia taxi TaxID=2499688 RepID=UPI002E24E8BE|nr:DeoR/GlpR family DNA-binding transcription regulator [Niallia taxi]MED4119314.1 DeoR/GlpR family DNA-binding transcription regulator [Niallia taxi]
MLKNKRIKEIQDYVFEHETVSLDELVEVFNVSKNTIRRDIQELVEEGELKKVYGGVAINHATLVSFNDRQIRNKDEKMLIGKSAAEFVEDGDIIFIDSGTTTLEMLEFLKTKQLSIITNNLDFIIKALPYENLHIITFGGVLERKTKSFASIQSTDVIKSYNINKAFMASTGISISNGVTNSSPLESEIKKHVVERSAEVYLLVDHHKFDKYALMTYCTLHDIDCLITGAEPPKEYQNFTKENNIKLIITAEKEE